MTRRPIEGSAEHPIDLMDFSYGPIVLLDYEPLEPVADTTGKSVSYQADSTRIRTPRRRANFETPRREYAPDPEVGAQRNAQHKDHSEQTASRKRGLSNPVSLPNRDRGFQERSLSPPHDNRYRRLRNRSSSPPREFNRKAERLRLAIIDAESTTLPPLAIMKPDFLRRQAERKWLLMSLFQNLPQTKLHLKITSVSWCPMKLSSAGITSANDILASMVADTRLGSTFTTRCIFKTGC